MVASDSAFLRVNSHASLCFNFLEWYKWWEDQDESCSFLCITLYFTQMENHYSIAIRSPAMASPAHSSDEEWLTQALALDDAEDTSQNEPEMSSLSNVGGSKSFHDSTESKMWKCDMM
jgi:hypothetical protein